MMAFYFDETVFPTISLEIEVYMVFLFFQIRLQMKSCFSPHHGIIRT